MGKTTIKATAMNSYYTRDNPDSEWQSTGVTIFVDVAIGRAVYSYAIRVYHNSWTWRIETSCGVTSETEAGALLAVAKWMSAVYTGGKWGTIRAEDIAAYLAERCGIPYSQGTADACANWAAHELIAARNAA